MGAGFAMANEWHFTRNGQPAGSPVSAAQLKQMATDGQLQPTDMVWQDGMTAWTPAAAVKGLFPTARLPAPASAEKTSGLTPQPPNRPARRPGGGLAGMNPWLVLVLTVVTAGLFGLFYVWRVCGDYGRTSRESDAAGRILGRRRHPAAVLVLSYLTGGIYFSYWTFRVSQECGAYTGGKTQAPPSELALMLLCPPYAGFVALFRLPELVRRTQTTAGSPEATALVYAPLFFNPCLLILFFPLLAMLLQDALNQVWDAAP
jgi:hypothetical protein